MSSTRGVKKLKSYLGASEPILSRAKTAKDVAPVLMQKALDQRAKLQRSKSLEELTDHDESNNSNRNKNTANATNSKKEVAQGLEQYDQELLMNDKHNIDSNTSLSSSVLEYLHQYCVQSTDNNTPAIHSISKKQLQLVQSLGINSYNGNNNTNTEGEAAHITIKRACLHNVDAIADTLALAALQRANAGADNGLEQSTIFVLVDDVPSALSLRRTFVDKYKLHVLLLTSEDEETQYATIIAQEAELDGHDKDHNKINVNNTDDCHSAMSRAKQKAMPDSSSSPSNNSIVDTNRFPTFPYAKKDNNNKVSVTPSRSPTRALVSRQHTSYRTVTAKANKHQITHHDQKEEENRNENKACKTNMSYVEHNITEQEDVDKGKAEMLNHVQEPVVIVIATPGVMTTVDKRSALWKFVGAFCIVLLHTSLHSSPLLQMIKHSEEEEQRQPLQQQQQEEEKLKNKEKSNDNTTSALVNAEEKTNTSKIGNDTDHNRNTKKSSVDALSSFSSTTSFSTEIRKASSLVLSLAQISQFRWSCLGHCPVACVLALQDHMLTLPQLDWLLTLHFSSVNTGVFNNSKSSNMYIANKSVNKDDDNNNIDNVNNEEENQSHIAAGVVTLKAKATNTNIAKDTSHTTYTSILHPLHMLRVPVHVYYSIVEGSARLQFILSMIASLAPHRGLLIHVASRPMAEYLYLLLTSVLQDELVPSHVEVLSDYDIDMSHNQSTSNDDNNIITNKVHTMTSAQCTLCNEFNKIVSCSSDDNSQKASSAVLISCYGLVPLAGSIFVEYDAILDFPNFMHFVSEVLTPGAHKSNNKDNISISICKNSSSANKCMNYNTESNNIEIEQRTHVQSRKRSISPVPRRHCTSRVQGQLNINVNTSQNTEIKTPLRKRTRSISPTPLLNQAHEVNTYNKTDDDDDEMNTSTKQAKAENHNTNDTNYSDDGSSLVEVVEHAHYKHIIVLLRQHELGSVLHYWNADAKRFHITLSPLPYKVSATQYLHLIHKLQSKQRKVFTLQNTAYEAYKATMTIYSSLSPHSVYDVNKLKLQKVGEEFGYTNSPPLLDLRLKSNTFRPREDYYKAALQKREHERREYKAFALRRIHGEAPEVHDTERHEKVSTKNKKKKRRKY